MNWFGQQGMVFLRGGFPHIKVTGMLIVSLKDRNCGFWSHSGCSGQEAIILGHRVSLTVALREISARGKCSHALLSMASFMGQIKPKPRPDWSLLGVNSSSPTGIPDTFIWEGRAFCKQFLS